jgi:methylamine dehydrogenase accessory protein MauD
LSSASEIALWIAVLAEGLLILGLMREVGLIQLRVGPMTAMGTPDQGLPVGTEAPDLDALGLDARPILAPRPNGKPRLFVFASPSCGVCHQMVEPIAILAKAERRFLDVVVVCSDNQANCREFLKTLEGECEIVLDDGGSVKKAFNVSGSSFGIVVDADGKIGQSGVVNNLQHLEYLLRSLSNTGRLLLPEETDRVADPLTKGAGNGRS